jgi:hypothetical protein
MTLSDSNPRRQLHEIEAEAKEYDKALRVDDHRLSGYVYVVTDDWCTFVFDAAFAVTVDDNEWLVVFTEHRGVHVFSMNDVFIYRWFTGHVFPAPPAPWQEGPPSEDPPG